MIFATPIERGGWRLLSTTALACMFAACGGETKPTPPAAQNAPAAGRSSIPSPAASPVEIAVAPITLPPPSPSAVQDEIVGSAAPSKESAVPSQKNAAAPNAAPSPASSVCDRFLLFTPQSPLIVEVEISVKGEPLEAAFKKLVDQALAAADTDGDGRATWNEIVASPPFRNGQFGNLPIDNDAAAKQLIELYDRDKNGVAARDEIPRFLTRNAGGARAFSIRGTTEFRDTNRRGSPVWNALNTDDDRSTLSAAEIAAAPARLRGHDADDDDILTAADFRTVATNVLGSEISQRRRGPGLDAAKLLAPNVKWDLVQGALEEHYSLTGKLSAANFPLVPRMFAELDGDHNGRLSKTEIPRLASIAPHLKLAVRFGDAAPAPALGQIQLVSVAPDLQPQVSLTGQRPGRLALQLAGMNLTFYTNDQVTGQQYEAQAKQALETLDADKNGYLEAKEIPAEAAAQFGRFEALDTDGNGKAYVAEIAAFLELRDAALAAQVHAQAADREDAIFLALNANGDERLDGQEMDQAPRRLSTFDANQDGQLEGEEFPPAMIVGFARGSLQNATALFTPTPLAPIPPTTDAPHWFSQMDSNGDGLISHREFLGTPEQFQAVDKNRDGFLAPLEAAAGKPAP